MKIFWVFLKLVWEFFLKRIWRDFLEIFWEIFGKYFERFVCEFLRYFFWMFWEIWHYHSYIFPGVPLTSYGQNLFFFRKWPVNYIHTLVIHRDASHLKIINKKRPHLRRYEGIIRWIYLNNSQSNVSHCKIIFSFELRGTKKFSKSSEYFFLI